MFIKAGCQGNLHERTERKEEKVGSAIHVRDEESDQLEIRHV